MKKIVTLFLAAVFLYSCGGNDKNTISESGTIESTEVIVSSQTAGKVLKLYKDEGAGVKTGDTLLVIDTESLELQYKQAAAARDMAKAQYDLMVKGARKEDIAQAEEGLKQTEANFDLAKTDNERMTNLYKGQAITKKQMDDSQARFVIAQAQLNSARENLSKLKNIARPEEIAQAKANYERNDAAVALIEKSIRDCSVISPINGFVVKKFVEAGETVSMMSALEKLSDLSSVELSIYVSETDLGKVKLGQTADVTVDSFSDKTFKGAVEFISPEAEFTPKNIQTKDERTKLVFKVKIKIDNPNFELKSGMPADAVINL